LAQQRGGEFLSAAVAEQRTILKAIEGRKPAAARQAMVMHLRSYRERAMEALHDLGPLVQHGFELEASFAAAQKQIL